MLLPSALPRWPVLAVLALLLLGAAAILTVTLMAAHSQDRLAASKSEAMLEATLQAKQHEIANLTRDYSFWSDAVKNLVDRPDPDWADTNIGDYLHSSFSVSASFVIDAGDNPTIVYVDGARTDPAAAAPVLRQIKPLLEAARAAAAEPWTADTGPEPASGVVSWHGMPAVAAVGALVPQNGSPGTAWRHALVLLRSIDEPLLAELAQDYGFKNLRWVGPEAGALPTAVALRAADGPLLGYLTWKPEAPGRALLKEMLPVMLAAFAVMAALSAGLIAFLERNRAALRRQRTIIEAQNRAFQEQKERAEQLSRAKSDFLSIISHELRTPLNAIIGFAELIHSEVRGPIGVSAYREYADDIRTSGQQLLGLINDILDLSRIEAGKFELREDRVSLSRVAEGCVNLLRQQFDQKKLTLEIQGLAQLGSIHADERLVRQMLINLLSNAIKFTPERGTVTLSGGPAPDGGVEIRVVDTGIGMSVEEQQLALEPFVQIESSLARRVEGSGLGLSITKRFIELHGGRLVMQSRKGLGTAVTLWFPPSRQLEADRMAG